MRKEYDLSKGERGKFFGKVDAAHPVVDQDDEPLEEAFEGELAVLESNLGRIETLKTRLAELDTPIRDKFVRRISKARETLDEIALAK
jgi:hypothetical protein